MIIKALNFSLTDFLHKKLKNHVVVTNIFNADIQYRPVTNATFNDTYVTI